MRGGFTYELYAHVLMALKKPTIIYIQCSGTVLLSPKRVSSTLRGLTLVFGMGTSVALSLKAPENCIQHASGSDHT
jgi:hypothetical protein